MRLARLYRHPVKSLGSESLKRVALTPDRALPHDRAYAVAHGRSAFDPAAPAWTRCHEFLRIANLPALAALPIEFDPETQRFGADHPEAGPIRADLSTAEGRAALAAWLEGLCAQTVPGPYRLAHIGGEALTDSPLQTLSIMSLASLGDLETRMGARLDPRRFRGNLWLEGEALAPWAENGWIGRRLAVGPARLEVLEPIIRCMATAADPESGRRDVFPTRALAERSEDPAFGVLARVTEGGAIAPGDPARLL